MPRRAAQITQAEVARIIRAAKQAGASEVVVKIGETIESLGWGNPQPRRSRLNRTRRSSCDGDHAPPPPAVPYREVTRHGSAVWYVRRNGKRIRLRAEFGTPEFDAEYQMALAAHQPATEVRTTAGTLGWLIECFRGAAAWQARSESTRAKWDGIYRQVLKAAGNAPLSAITPKVIRAGLERRSKTPGQAQHFFNAMRASISVGGQDATYEGRSNRQHRSASPPP